MDDRPDLVVQGSEPDDGEWEDDTRGPGLLRQALAPEALALTSVVLAAVSLIGLGLLNGTAYLPLLYGSGAPDRSSLIAAGLLGAGLALVPTALGVVALRRLSDDGRWGAVAGAGAVLGAVACLLRLVNAAMTAAQDEAPFPPF